MGLDMYLNKHNYINNSEWLEPEHRRQVVVYKNGKVDESIIPRRVSYVVEEIGYWRKANQIHKWFVDNVQDGDDNCGSYFVSRENLSNLLETCKEVISNPSKAEELLPRQSGFFYGSTEYDEYYFDGVENTIVIIEEALSDKNADHFTYSSSW